MQNYNLKLKIFRFFIVILIFAFSILNLAIAAAPQELKESINQKSKELLEISEKIKENQKNLEEIQDKGQTLKQEIGKIDSNVKQVNLGVRSSEVAIEKINLEVNYLKYDISDAEKSIIFKKEAIAKTLQEFQKKDGESLLVVILKNKSLAESVFEVQNLTDLSAGLSSEIKDLMNAKIELNDKLKETNNKKQAIEIEKENLKNKKIILSHLKDDKQNLLKQTKNQEKIYQKIVDDLEKKQAEIAAEIEKLDEELRLKIDPSALPAKRPGVLAMPVSGPMSQGYGATNFARSGGYRGKWHNGVDFAAPVGTPVFAAEKGKVAAVGNQDNYCYRGAYGKFVVIEHENNLTTLYAHLSLQTVKGGAQVERGELIGYIGRTGYATGPHLHFTVYAGQTFKMGPSRVCGPMPFGGDLNPLDYL
jgi:murein DD-endopeptidase MepM/ murein hydrolase activator NlpD